MSSDPLEALTNQLFNTKVAGEGVSFVGKSLKLNNASDAKIVTDAISACKNMEYLNLEGNTLGVDAAKAIGSALGSHPELKRALWKDMFTGRMKNEIPEALRFLGGGLEMANVRLVELDLSDNAFGPIGMEGLASVLKSSSCYALQELRLNNNGLGINGAKLLSRALLDCHESSKTYGKSLPLRVFIAGRNRLENEGITALSQVFKVLGSLEEIQIPQNGIYHVGIKALSEALKKNPGLRILNLNDNTLGPKGSTALASALPCLQMLKKINLGDCLLKTDGVISIAGGLQTKHVHLEELLLDHNEIKEEGALVVINAIENKLNLKTLSLDGNCFGGDGVKLIKSVMKKVGKSDALGSLSEDEGDDEEDGDENSKVSEDENSEPEGIDSEKEQSFVNTSSLENAMIALLKNVTVSDFLQFPSPERFLALESNKSQKILVELKNKDGADYLDQLIPALMKVSGLTTEKTVSKAALDCSNDLYKELFSWASSHHNLSLVNNTLLVHLGLIKSEDKKWKAEYNQEGCRKALRQAMAQDYFPKASRDTILFFLERKNVPVETITINS